MIEKFKESDALEDRVNTVFDLSAIDASLSSFFLNCYKSTKLGYALYDAQVDAFAISSSRALYALAFNAIHENAEFQGTFSFWTKTFRAIWGENVDIVFDVPSKGVLNVEISGLEIENAYANYREIVDGGYVYDNILTQAGDFLIFQTSKGIKRQDQVDRIVFEIGCYGIYTEVTLILS